MDPVLTVVAPHQSTTDDSEVVAALARLSQPDVDSSERNSLEELITRHYLPMARRVASRFAGSGADIEDLTQVACLALVKAIRRFDHERGGFWQYAQVTISGELKRHLRDHAWAIRPPRRVQDLHTQIGKATERLAQTTGRMPKVGDLAEQLTAEGSEVTEALNARTCFNAMSLDQPSVDGGAALGDTLAGACEDLAAVEDRLALSGLLSGLNPTEREMLWLRFVEGMTQREIAQRLGMSQMMVSRRLFVLLTDLRERAGYDEVA